MYAIIIEFSYLSGIFDKSGPRGIANYIKGGIILRYKNLVPLFLCLLFTTYCLGDQSGSPLYAAEAEPPSLPAPARSADGEQAGKKVVAKVNGVELTERDLAEEMNRIIPQATYHGAPLRQKAEEFREQALQNIILQEIKYQEATRQRVKVKRKEIDKRWIR